ncbi:endolytic transglycosylase MltG [Kitasatospora sp. NPDC097643]|uniref:endolytic transglycosylase MltG n=1 Tax=Kitasatospora sp. NPDC097643 TaxID=3157230 RepID=UPI0033307532
MTDLGRGYGPQGSEPWHPGDPGYGGQQPVLGQQDGQWQQHQQYSQQGQQGQQVQQPYGEMQQGYPQQSMGQQGYPQQQMAQQGYQQQGYQGGQQYPQQQMSQQQMSQQGYPQQQMPQQGYGQQQAMPQQGYPQQQGYQQQPGMPQQPGTAQQAAPAPAPAQAAPAPSGPGPDGIDWEAEAAALEAGAAPVGAHEAAEEEWDDHAEAYHEDGGHHEEPGQPEEVGFLGEEDNSRDAQKKRKEKGKKSGRRNGGACLLVLLVLLGAMGGAGWWGYGFYKDHFGPPPDFTGEGTGSAQVEVKPGAFGAQVGLVLKNAGVVKSVEAYSKACDNEPKCKTIQPGFYAMKKEMSASAALQALIEQAGGAALVLPEGLNSTEIYAKIDDKLKLQKGTTANVAKAQVASLGLPDYAKGNIEGFLWPTRYNIAEGMKPEDLLKQMVKNATEKYANLDGQAAKAGLKNGYEVLIEASILQREGNNTADFAKMAKTIQNRLANEPETHHTLGMDTTLQYSLGRKQLDKKDMDDASNKYNTYRNPGLPPGPISNPGDDAINAVLNPADGKWLYFIAMSPTETRFAETSKEHYANVEAYCKAAGQGFDKERGHCTSAKQ